MPAEPPAAQPPAAEPPTAEPPTGASPGAGAPPEPSGPELARATLEAALARRGTRPPARRPGSSTGKGKRPTGYSGPGPDPRDPQLFGSMVQRLIKQRGWQQPATEGRIFGAWEQVVGPDIAAHCRPVKLENKELTIEAESTAWATQLRLLAGKMLLRIGTVAGRDVIARLSIRGPVAPSWSKGARRVPGRGPRDTYG